MNNAGAEEIPAEEGVQEAEDEAGDGKEAENRGITTLLKNHSHKTVIPVFRLLTSIKRGHFCVFKECPCFYETFRVFRRKFTFLLPYLPTSLILAPKPIRVSLFLLKNKENERRTKAKRKLNVEKKRAS